MPTLKNPKHELFIQAIVKGNSGTESARLAGYTGDEPTLAVSASRLLKNANILARKAELQGRIAERVVEKTAVTRADILEEIRKIALAPIGDEHVRASDKRAACMDYAKIEGWVIERQEHGAPGEFADLDRMSPDELRNYLVAESEALSLRGETAGAARGESRTGARKGEAGSKLH